MALVLGGVAMGGCMNEGPIGGAREPLLAVCVGSPDEIPSGALVCPGVDQQVECNRHFGATVDRIYMEREACDFSELTTTSTRSFDLGDHTVTVFDETVDAACVAEFTVRDTRPPVATTHAIAPLWPPNHTMHGVAIEDCVTAVDVCDPDVYVRFVWVTSDEPADDIGDGHHAPDIVMDDCGHIQLRAERQGPRDGRVYTLGWRATDHTGGNAVSGTCTVAVHHDQSGRHPVRDSGVAHRVDFARCVPDPRPPVTVTLAPPPGVTPPPILLREPAGPF